MKKFVVLMLTLVLIPSIQSCKKKEEPKPSAKELITKDDWTVVKLEFYDANGNLTNTYNYHNKWVFVPSMDYYMYDDSGDLQSYGTWSLLDDDSKIRFQEHAGIYDYTFDIDKLSDNEFQFSMTGSSGKVVYYLSR